MTSRARRPALFLLASALLSLPAVRSATAAPVLAVEDTIRLASGALPEYVVRARRVALDEILRRVAEGEARRDSLMKDQAFTRIVRMVYRFDQSDSTKAAVRKLEDARRVFKKRPDLFREVPLRREKDGKSDADVEIRTNPGMSEQVASFAFEPRARSSYRFTIEDRKWVGGHVVYVIGFEPKSLLDPLPTGKVWIDTNEYVILREEFWYRDRSPVPLFLERVDRCVVERSRIAGKWWVITRLFGRVRLAGPAMFFGNVGKNKTPPTIDFSALYTDWQVNEGLPDSLFQEGP